jgi:hypothetical protein
MAALYLMVITRRTILYLLGLILYMVYLVYLNAMAGYIPLAVEIILLLILLTLKLTYSDEKPWHKLRRRKGRPAASGEAAMAKQGSGGMLDVNGGHRPHHLSAPSAQSYGYNDNTSPPSSGSTLHQDTDIPMLRSPDMEHSAPAVALTTQRSGATKLVNGQHQQQPAMLSLFRPSRGVSGGVASAEQPVFGVSRLGRTGSGAMGRVGSGGMGRVGSGSVAIRVSDRQGSLGTQQYRASSSAGHAHAPAGPEGAGNV